MEQAHVAKDMVNAAVTFTSVPPTHISAISMSASMHLNSLL